MGLFDIFKKKPKLETMFFDSIEDMEACGDCPVKFSYDGYPATKLKYYKLSIRGVAADYNDKKYICINVTGGIPTLDDILNNDNVSISTLGQAVYVRVTDESYVSKDPFYIFHGFKNGMD
jgi:hypothetical protein